MLDAVELEELRSLQARAYGRDGGLAEADAARLRHLEDRRVLRTTAVADAGAVGAGAVVPTRVAEVERTAHAEREAGGTAPTSTPPVDDDADTTRTGSEGDEPPAPAPEVTPLRALLRRHWRPVAIAAVAVLLLGVGVGWFAFGRSVAAAVELTAAQQGWQDDLVSSGVYDAGSIRALAVEEGAGVWTATTGDGERVCLILSTGDVTQPRCDRRETAVQAGLYGSIAVKGADDRRRQLSVQMLFTAAGEPAIAVSAYDYDPSVGGITYANEQESNTAKRLVDEGFEANSLWVVGYDGDVPVWTGVQTDTQNQCLIHDGSTAESPVICADPETMQDQSTSTLVLNVVDAETGAVTHLELLANRGPAYLVITRESGVIGAAED